MGVHGVVDVVGRDAEVAEVERLLDESRLAAAVLVGDAGIGKTVIWRQAVESARRRGDHVLACRAAGAEVKLSFAALADLLEDVVPATLQGLPEPQREAVEVALLLRSPPRGGVDVRAVGSGLLAILRSLAADGPVLVAVDDVHWLDTSSAHALRFALRRLGAEPVRVLLSERPEPQAPLDLDGMGLAARRIDVGPLSTGAIQRLLRLALDFRPPRPLLLRVHEASGGNPLHALELGRALVESGAAPAAGEPLPAPLSVADAVTQRLEALPASCRTALVELAAHGRGTAPVADLEPALAAGIVEQRAGRIWFAHPLFAATVYGAAGAPERRAAHAALAQRAQHAEQRARHLALAAEGPSETVAAIVADAAEQALRRGAPTEAVALYEHAVSLTPAGVDELGERALGAAEANRRAGNEDGGRAIARAALARELPAATRARLLIWLADAESTVAAADDAVVAAEAHPTLLPAALNARAEARLVGDDVDGALADAERAVEAARAAGERTSLVRALSHVGHLTAMSGRPGGLERLLEAVELQDPDDPGTLLHGPATATAVVRLWRDELDEAEALLLEQHAHAAALGDDRVRASLLQRLARVALWKGELGVARDLADELVELKEGEGWDDPVSGLWVRSLVRTQLGLLDEAEADAERARELAVLQDDPDHFHVVFARGYVGAARGAVDAAVTQLERLPSLIAAAGIHEPGVCPYHADELEALVASGRLDQAARRVDEVEALARRFARPRLAVAAARGRGLLAEAEDRREDALAAFGAAVTVSADLPIPFERGRALLDLGTALRRARRRAEAREALTAAAETFAAVGARPWLVRTQAELARLGGRSSATALTATEERVAELAARGRSTKEIAAALVVSPKTVEKHLTSIYAKLGVRSRAELAARASGA